MNEIITGDCLSTLRFMSPESVDLLVTDPPYGYSFMGKDWDKAVPSVEIWKECLRVLKPGAFAFVMSAPRQDVLSQMIVRLGMAGFDTSFTSIYWTYASGFPKAANVAKNISKLVDNITTWKGYLETARPVDEQFRKQLTEAGLLTAESDSVVYLAQEVNAVRKSSPPVKTAENQSNEAQAMSEDSIIIVVENADISPTHSSITVNTAVRHAGNLSHSIRQQITVQESVLTLECERILDRIRADVAPKTERGSLQFLKTLDIGVLYAELIESWRHIISSQLRQTPNSDTTSITECASATTVITTKSIMERLISNTVGILGRSLSKLTDLDGAYCGFQPKPAVEVIIVAMKPLSEKTYVDQALANGKGITWLDDCRIPYQNEDDKQEQADKNPHTVHADNQVYGDYSMCKEPWQQPTQGRFPANLLVSDDVLNDGKNHSVSGTAKLGKPNTNIPESASVYGKYGESTCYMPKDSGSYSRYFDLDKWAEKTLPFLIVPKASKSEKDKGLENEPDRIGGGMQGTQDQSLLTGSGNIRNNIMKNNHPTVKPLRLMSYLITMGSRPNDIVLDPFSGSGTTCLAAKQLGRQYLGIELSEEYATIARKRLDSVEPNLLSF